MDEKTLKQNMHKIAYIATLNRTKPINHISQMFSIKPLNFNVAAWTAEDEGLIKVSRKTALIKEVNPPKEWDFGPEVPELKKNVLYTFKKLGAEEGDLEDNQFGFWVSDYRPEDVYIAVKSLIEEGKLASYVLTNTHTLPAKGKKGSAVEVVKDDYTFYTLPENVGKKWGKKQFPNQKLVS